MKNDTQYIKIAPNPSNILTDEEWRSYVFFYRDLYTLEQYESHIKQPRAISTYYEHELNNKKLLCDRIWHKEK